jgi:sensor histidine kinase regulating citrate/malate metabolism
VDLTTTNVLLGIMAAVSLLEAAAVIALLGGAFVLSRRLVNAITGLEQRQIAPVVTRVNAILDDVKAVSGVTRTAADNVDGGVRTGLAWLLRFLRSSARS